MGIHHKLHGYAATARAHIEPLFRNCGEYLIGDN